MEFVYLKSNFLVLKDNIVIDDLKPINVMSINNLNILEIDLNFIDKICNNLDIDEIYLCDIIIKIGNIYILNLYNMDEEIMEPIILNIDCDSDKNILKEIFYEIFKIILSNNITISNFNDIYNISSKVPIGNIYDILGDYNNLIYKMNYKIEDLFLFLLKKNNIQNIK